MKEVSIKLYELGNKKENITIPLPPEELEYKSSSRLQEYEILDLGKVSIPKGRNLSTIGWEGILPAITRKRFEFIHDELKQPGEYIEKIENWRKKHKKVQVQISKTPLKSKTMYVEEFNYTISAAGDYKYTILFIEAAELKLNRTVRKSKKGTKKYKVKRKSETLRDISKKFYGDGSKYQRIYKANKALIDKKNAEMKKKGEKVKSKYTIYRGQVLTIPPATSAEKKKLSILALQKAINKDKKYGKVPTNGKLDASTKTVLKKIFIKVGSRGEVVKFVQGKVGATKDGICGSKTKAKIKKYQKKHNLSADGIAGIDTLTKMVS